jgi:hypothetical protein
METSQNDYIRQHYANTKTSDIAFHLGISVGKVYRIATKLGLKKSKEYLETSNSHRFKSGNVPWNKGVKMYNESFLQRLINWFKK